jgi:hypothetical protein
VQGPFMNRPLPDPNSLGPVFGGPVKLGIGTAAPAYPLEIDTTAVNSEFIVKRTDGSSFKVSAMANSGQFGTITNHPLSFLLSENIFF